MHLWNKMKGGFRKLMHNNWEISLNAEAMIHLMVKVEVLFDPTYDINICSCSEVFRGVTLNGKVINLSIILLFAS